MQYAKRLSLTFLPVIGLLLLSGCIVGDKNGWENMYQGKVYDNIYTGDDHI